MNSFEMSADLFRTSDTNTTASSSASSATNGTSMNHHNLLTIPGSPHQILECQTTPTSRIPIPSYNSFRRSGSLRLRGERGYLPRINGKLPATLAPLSGINRHNSNALHVAASGYARPQHSTTESHTNGLQVPGVDTTQTGNRVRSLSLSLSSPRLSSSTSRINPRTPPTSPDAVQLPNSLTHSSHYNNQIHNSHTNTNQLKSQTNNKLHAKSHSQLHSNQINNQLHLKHQSHGNLYDVDDDLDSLNSYTSIASTTSCDHPYVAHNGTTFSGRRMKYVVHCTAHAGQTGDEYLTPTQRAQKQIKRLKFLLHQAKQDIEQKDSDIFRLTKEVVELRVNKAALNSPDEKSNSSEAVTVKENATDDMKTPDSPTCCTDFTDDTKTPYEKSCIDVQSSSADSGHFDDLNLLPIKETRIVSTSDKAILVRLSSEDEQKIVEMYEKKLEELIRTHGNETQELKEKHNAKIEELLQRLSDVNMRYCQLVPNYEQARDKITELEKQLDEVNKQLQEEEEKNKQLYLQMYNKGIEAARLEQREQVMALAQQSPSRVSVSDLLQQLQVTATELENMRDTEFMAEHVHAQSLLSAKEAVSLWVLGARKAMYRRLVEMKNSQNQMDPEITLQFLKSAIYYFLTDKENHQGHLRAIQSILGFSPSEISNIDKARTS